MTEDSEAKRQPRRPRRDSGRDRDRGRGRDRPREPDSDEAKERIDREFEREIEMRISYFLQSEEQELELEPMNSYRRRMVHGLASTYQLTTESRGEDRERYVCLVKSGETPAAQPSSKAPAARPSREPPAARPSSAAPADRPSREPSADRPSSAAPVRLWDFGNQTFPVNPGSKGVLMGLKTDGSLEILSGSDRSQVVAERLVTTREFRVRQGKLLIPGDAGY